MLLGLLTAVFGFAGVFAVYSYLASMMTEVMGFGESSVTLVLALFGIGMTLGALVAGPLTDRALRPTLYGSLAALAAGAGGLPLHRACEVGRAGDGRRARRGRLHDHHPAPDAGHEEGQDAPTLASASNHSAFNLANAGGAWLGGAAIAAGWGWTSPRWSARCSRGRSAWRTRRGRAAVLDRRRTGPETAD